MAERTDHLAQILERKRREVRRRGRFSARYAAWSAARPMPRAPVDSLRRGPGEPPRVIAEIKLRSPSAGQIRERRPGLLPRIAASYAAHGAAAVSVLCDGPGFGGSPLDLARVSRATSLPTLFKEFVLEPVQLDLARAVGASMVLLLVRALSDGELRALVHAAHERGLWPVVEAADAAELERALATDAQIVGVNARDLRSFSVDMHRAAELVNRIPLGRIGVFMSGVRSASDFERVARTRADCVLIGEGLIRAQDPGLALAALLGAG